jgi:hypothetical protein
VLSSGKKLKNKTACHKKTRTHSIKGRTSNPPQEFVLDYFQNLDERFAFIRKDFLQILPQAQCNIGMPRTRYNYPADKIELLETCTMYIGKYKR